ncbi:MAG: hypothetical protein CFE39_16485 [Comamonadaceae bacterium PBBC2]|nr:MAG: hypothetical protein CFE39_16485 [Comamonadaceae bacterium PBBC2]
MGSPENDPSIVKEQTRQRVSTGRQAQREPNQWHLIARRAGSYMSFEANYCIARRAGSYMGFEANYYIASRAGSYTGLVAGSFAALDVGASPAGENSCTADQA